MTRVPDSTARRRPLKSFDTFSNHASRLRRNRSETRFAPHLGASLRVRARVARPGACAQRFVPRGRDPRRVGAGHPGLMTSGTATPAPQALLLAAGGHTCVAWWHAPAAAARIGAAPALPLAVVLASSWGDEDMAGYDGLRALAIRLAEHGFGSLRFEWPDTGDSSATTGAASIADALARRPRRRWCCPAVNAWRSSGCGWAPCWPRMPPPRARMSMRW
jgi:hypothetical protein